MHNWWIWLPVAYICGSLPFGLLIGFSRGVDIRKGGSGNVGATNVSRLLGRPWGILCFVLDAAKGAIPVLAAGLWMGLLGRKMPSHAEACPWLAIGAAAFLGHVFPVWLGFRGGKGVATGLGAMLTFFPILTLPAIFAGATWLLIATIFRYVSLASLVASAMLPLYLILSGYYRLNATVDFAGWFRVLGTALRRTYDWIRPGADANWSTRWNLPLDLMPFFLTTLALAIMVAIRHRSNLRRLIAGTEPRIGQKI